MLTLKIQNTLKCNFYGFTFPLQKVYSVFKFYSKEKKINLELNSPFFWGEGGVRTIKIFFLSQCTHMCADIIHAYIIICTCIINFYTAGAHDWWLLFFRCRKKKDRQLVMAEWQNCWSQISLDIWKDQFYRD